MVSGCCSNYQIKANSRPCVAGRERDFGEFCRAAQRVEWSQRDASRTFNRSDSGIHLVLRVDQAREHSGYLFKVFFQFLMIWGGE
jgi:hypothetical protein